MLFRLVQAWWKKASKIGLRILRRKKYIKNTKMLIFNFELLPFIDYKCANKFYLNLKKLEVFNVDLYAVFFTYFEKTWFTCKNKINKIIFPLQITFANH